MTQYPNCNYDPEKLVEKLDELIEEIHEIKKILKYI